MSNKPTNQQVVALWGVVLVVNLLMTQASPVVETLYGTIEGFDSPVPGVEVFLGISYAEAPIGDLRFAPAQRIAPWTTLDATDYCKSCITNSEGSSNATVPERIRVGEPEIDIYTRSTDAEGEDCLCINVWRPSGTKAGDDLPVAFFIHGGGFTSGSSSISWYAGGNLSLSQQMIVVTTNYRLGPLGFLSSPEIEALGFGTGGANGILDQISALNFTEEIISDFGGDPSTISIFGESAGGLSTCVLSVSPLAKGLFVRSISESAACTGPWGPGSKEWGIQVSAQLMQSLGAATLAELRQLPASAFVWPDNYASSNPGYDEQGWLSVIAPGYWVDGFVIPEFPVTRYLRGELNVMEFLIGANSEDGITPYEEQLYPIPQTETAYGPAMTTHWGSFASQVMDQYPVNLNDDASYEIEASRQFVRADGQYVCNCAIAYTNYSLANLLRNANATVYHYYFSRGPQAVDESVLMYVVPEGDYGWSSHWSEIPFVFGTDTNGYGWYDPFYGDETSLRNSMMNYWGTFLKSGIPADISGYGPTWTPYDVSQMHTLNLTNPPHVTQNALAGNCAFWGANYPSPVD